MSRRAPLRRRTARHQRPFQPTACDPLSPWLPPAPLAANAHHRAMPACREGGPTIAFSRLSTHHALGGGRWLRPLGVTPRLPSQYGERVELADVGASTTSPMAPGRFIAMHPSARRPSPRPRWLAVQPPGASPGAAQRSAARSGSGEPAHRHAQSVPPSTMAPVS